MHHSMVSLSSFYKQLEKHYFLALHATALDRQACMSAEAGVVAADRRACADACSDLRSA